MLRPKIDLKSTRIFSPKPFSFESLRSGKVTTATEGLLKSEFAIIPTYSTADSLCQMKTNFPAKLNSYEPYPIQVLRERKFCLRFCTSSIKRELQLGTLRRGRAVTARKCTNKRNAHAEMLFCLLKILSSRCQQLRQFVTTKESFYLKGKKVQLPRPILVWDTNMADVRGGRACKGSIVFVISALSQDVKVPITGLSPV